VQERPTAVKVTTMMALARVAARATITLCAVLSVLAGPLVGAEPASAAACGSSGNYYDGYYYPNNSSERFEGASTYLVVRPSGLCSTDSSIITNFSNSWSMIAGQGACEWAQSGFENRYNKPIQHFAQVAKNCGSVTTVYWPTNLVSGEKQAHPNRGCRSWGLKPPVSSRLRAM
jgi:hypothetical protein